MAEGRIVLGQIVDFRPSRLLRRADPLRLAIKVGCAFDLEGKINLRELWIESGWRSKTTVYQLAEYRNQVEGAAVIPQRVIDRPPSAELAPGQVDQDSLPPYDELDAVLQHYIEEDWSIDEIAASGFDREMVVRVVRMVVRNEYKRRQAPPGVRVSKRAFGRDRRYPITSRYEQD